MFIVRPEQLEAFRTAALRSFEDEMTAHLARFSPPLMRTAGEAQVREAIRFGVAKAAGYGFDRRGPVRLYLELMPLFGSYFDDDPQYPWAAEVLGDAGFMPQMDRAQRLYACALDYRRSVNGPADRYTIDALRAITELARRWQPPTAGSLEACLSLDLTCLYPQKTTYVGNDVLAKLVEEGIDSARRSGLATPRGAALTVEGY